VEKLVKKEKNGLENILQFSKIKQLLKKESKMFSKTLMMLKKILTMEEITGKMEPFSTQETLSVNYYTYLLLEKPKQLQKLQLYQLDQSTGTLPLVELTHKLFKSPLLTLMLHQPKEAQMVFI
jgi:hypothetical protein